MFSSNFSNARICLLLFINTRLIGIWNSAVSKYLSSQLIKGSLLLSHSYCGSKECLRTCWWQHQPYLNCWEAGRVGRAVSAALHKSKKTSSGVPDRGDCEEWNRLWVGEKCGTWKSLSYKQKINWFYRIILVLWFYIIILDGWKGNIYMGLVWRLSETYQYLKVNSVQNPIMVVSMWPGCTWY